MRMEEDRAIGVGGCWFAAVAAIGLALWALIVEAAIVIWRMIR